MATTTSSSKQLQQSQFSTPQEALTHIVGSGAQIVYDAKWSLQQIRGGDLDLSDTTKMFEVLEPLVRAVGWVEHDLYEKATGGPAVASFGNNGGQQGRS